MPVEASCSPNLPTAHHLPRLGQRYKALGSLTAAILLLLENKFRFLIPTPWISAVHSPDWVGGVLRVRKCEKGKERMTPSRSCPLKRRVGGKLYWPWHVLLPHVDCASCRDGPVLDTDNRTSGSAPSHPILFFLKRLT